jgi:tRNA dimethylallyltransferase
MIDFEKPIIVVAGPTASGKSSLALKLANDIDGYIINGDSRQIYKELKTGTAQPKPDSVKGDVWYINDIKHYLYGHISAKENYNLFQYQKDVQRVLDSEEKLPILVGGTGLYIDSIVHNYDLKESKDTEYTREKLEGMSVKELQSLLEPEILNRLNRSDIKNPIRLIRAIERGGVNRDKGRQLNYLYLVVEFEPDVLEDRIRERANQMFEDGLEEENRELIEAGFSYEMSPMHSIGYREFNGYFEGMKSLNQVKEEIVLHTIQYAKRQDTWFRRNSDTVKIRNYQQAHEEAVNFLSTS